ncbi:membrane protein [Brachybacterium phenoliresistens]|uniref:Membrane protein n=1 Tax=Brachybacterium phenoliresistens TaxID=396014 RepID=Z9JU46_9MICO|nr:TRAP transporter large permease subunit [Brachybacterium phenoliresistens]EWS81724.1 membrane protein [Brachybacterium phenoliresistens]
MLEALLAIVVFLVLLLMGVPVAFSIIAGAIVGLFAVGSLPMEGLAQQSFSPVGDYSMLAIPFFILTADLLFSGTLGGQVIGLATRVVGRFRGGVGMTSVLTNTVFSGISGSAVADATGIGKVVIPWTQRLGYGGGYATAVNASAATLGVILPPSIPMILFAAASGASVAEVFNAGVGPGVLTAVLLLVLCWAVAAKAGFPRVKARFTLKRLLVDLLFATPAILIPVILIRVVLFTGVATVTEVSVLAVIYAVAIRVLLYRDLSLTQLRRAVVESAAASAVVLVLIMFSSALAWLLTIQEAPQALAGTITGAFGQEWMVILAMIVILLVTGMFLDMAPAILLLTPVLLPLADAIGLDLIHLGIIMVVTLALGLYTPPVGTTLFISAAIGRVPVLATARALLPFYLVGLVVVLAVAYLPHLLGIT